MSREAAVSFLSRVRTDANLQHTLSAEPMPRAYVREGQRVGLAFTTDELRAVIHAERFYLEAQLDAGLGARLAKARNEAEVLALATARGFDCRIEDLRIVADEHAEQELTEAVLDQVAGGFRVAHAPSAFGPIPVPYPNF